MRVFPKFSLSSNSFVAPYVSTLFSLLNSISKLYYVTIMKLTRIKLNRKEKKSFQHSESFLVNSTIAIFSQCTGGQLEKETFFLSTVEFEMFSLSTLSRAIFHLVDKLHT